MNQLVEILLSSDSQTIAGRSNATALHGNDFSVFGEKPV
jgi:hypothetical protein